MAVAPSFKDFEQLCEPFTENGKEYIKVRNPKTGTERKVRWYSDKEYAKTYGNKVTAEARSQEIIRGFGDGPILVVRGIKPDDVMWLCASSARYAVDVGWYFVSNCEVPQDAPPHFKYLRLSWEEASTDGVRMKDEKTIKKILEQKARKGEWV